jgi:hypothetical protein
MALHETQLGFNRQALGMAKIMIDMGNLSDSILNGVNTVAALRALAHAQGFETTLRFAEQWRNHVDRLQAIGVLTDAVVADTDTVVAFKALMTANDSTISANGNQSSVV